MADGGGEKQLSYTQDNVSVRMLSSRGEETISGKLEITKEKHGHVVTWTAYPPASATKEQQQRYDENSAGVWEDLSADSAVSYHVGGKDKSQSLDSVKIKKENGTSSASGDSPTSGPHCIVTFEVTDITSYRCRQVADTHELTLNLSDGTRLPTFIFIERRYEHFIRALHEHISFKRSDPADPYCLVLTTPRQQPDDSSQASEQATEKAPSRPPSQPANNISKTGATAAPARPATSKPAAQAIQLFVSRAPNVIVQSQPDGQTRLVPQQAMRLLLSQGSHPPIEEPRPVRLVVQQTVPPPASPSPTLVGEPQVAWSASGLVISDVRSQAPGQPGSSYPGPMPHVRRRGPHWPTEEKMELLELLKNRRALINPRLGEGMSKKDKLEGWKEVTDILNRHHPTTGGRCLAEVKKQWQNLFLKAKRERRELLNDGTKTDADLTSAQFTGLSVKVFETFGEQFQLKDDDTPMDVDAGDSILGPSSCLESDAPYLSESHHPEVILLPRTPDPSEMADDSELKFGGAMSNGDSSQPFDDHVFNGENRAGSSEHSTTDANCPVPLMQIKKEPEDPPPELKQDYWAEPGGSEEERSAASWDARPHARTDYMDGQINGTTFMGSIAKMCDAVQKAASEVVLLKRREHKMKMSVLRAKMEYYETKRRKLQQQSEEGGGAA